MKKSTFYHAGCTVCVAAENELLNLIDESSVEVVHLGEENNRIDDAKSEGVLSVPALVTPNGSVLHINYGAAIEDLK